MAEAVLYGIAQEVLKNLGSTALKEIASAWRFNDQLNKLNDTISTLKDVLLDAEEKRAGADGLVVRNWLERLTMVVYAADDLFDEFATVAVQKQQSGGNKATKEVRVFFSSSNQIAFAFKISHGIKKIRQELDGIVKDGTLSSLVPRPYDQGRVIYTSTNRDQTYSYVDADEVIGRDDDKKAILDLLLPSSTIEEHDVLHVIPIVGMGGMGKTSLAQLICNDPQVRDCFELKLWVCVSEVFDFKVIVEKLLKSATNKEPEKLEMDQLLGLLRKEVGDKKYLLVLDDVWNEDREEWLKLKDQLKIGRMGSKILVTTRSKAVAEIMGTSPPHQLQGLSQEKSWDLFQKMAFKRGQAEKNPELVKVGKEIVKKCGQIPLAIRALGSLLYGKEESKWLSIKDTSLAKILDTKGDIMSILKVSYNHLWSPLKNCFAYCALFPKDYWFDKERLIELWMAEGFIDAIEGQTLEEVGEEYFLLLLQRGFFQDIKRNVWGDITRCKMHDFMHDLAQEVAGHKCMNAKLSEGIFDDKILHLSFDHSPLDYEQEIPIKNMLNLMQLRTLLLPGEYMIRKSTHQQVLTRFSNLRVLDLNRLGLEILPSSIGRLIHLRYLNLSKSNIKKLPKSITNLWNLQTLIIYDCRELRALPRNLRKLTNLRCLDVSDSGVTLIPSEIKGLTLLSKLPKFIVGEEPSTSNVKGKPNNGAKLSDLKNLNKLRGYLSIDIYHNVGNKMCEAAEAHLSCKHELTDLSINFYLWDELDEDEACCDHDEAVLEGLKPPSSIRILDINYYKGQKVPSWGRMNKFCETLPKLVKIKLKGCKSWQELPSLSQLRFLKELYVWRMESVEYMEGDISSSLFFPSLEVLELYDMENLKGWWKEEAMESHTELEGTSYESRSRVISKSLQFCKLSKLRIDGCPNMRLMLPPCPNVEYLTLTDSNDRLSVLNIMTSGTMQSSCSGSGCKLKELRIRNAEDLMFLPKHCLHQLSDLHIMKDKKLENTERLGEVFATLSSSLRSLRFYVCDNLRSISKGLEHLTALENLSFYSCTELDISVNEGEDDGMPWKALSTSLRSLVLSSVPKLVDLPSGLQHLSNLRSLSLEYNDELKELPEWISCLTSIVQVNLRDCPKLKSLPEAFRNLTSLNELLIIECPELRASCKGPDGSDWLKIKHIPSVFVHDWE